jgi:FAD/FMN-containing dehydrogenase
MNFSKLQTSGDLHTDPKILEKFCKDASSYRIMPALVAEPKSEQDVLDPGMVFNTEPIYVNMDLES